MEKISAAGLAEQIKRLTEAAFRGTLTEAVIAHHVKTYVYVRDTDQTQSVGLAWMEERADRFHKIVAEPLRFHRAFVHEGLYARLILVQREYLIGITDLDERKTFISELVHAHSVASAQWVNNLLGIGMKPHEVRRLVLERIKLDLKAGFQHRTSSFTHVFLSHGRTFEKPTTVYQGIWHLLGKEVFSEIIESVAAHMPRQTLSRVKAIREEFHTPTNKLIERCIDHLHSLQEVDMELLTSVKASKLYDLLFRLRAHSVLRVDVKSLFILLRMMIPRLDQDRHDRVILRVRGMLQEAEPELVLAVLREEFTSVEIEKYPALAHWVAELELVRV